MAQNNGKFVCYYRVSTGRQGKSGLCLEAQREAVKQYLNGGDWEIVAEHTEVESGKNSDRPALEKELADARLHRASLVVSKVDRLTRSVAFLSRLLEAGVDVRLADLAAFRKRVEMLCHVLDDRGDHEAAATVGAFGRALLDPAFKRPSN
jgi:resolvase-like protein